MLFNKRVAIEAPVVSRTATGQETTDSYDVVTGKESLPARVTPATEERVGERLTVIEDRFDILLGGNHPDLTTEMVVLDEAAVYDIKSVEPPGRLARPVTILIAQRVAI
jgi:hypothetical protein